MLRGRWSLGAFKMRRCKQSLGRYLDARQLDDLAAHRLRGIRFCWVVLMRAALHDSDQRLLLSEVLDSLNKDCFFLSY